VLEKLESRRLMSASATLDNGVLTIVGTDGDDQFMIWGSNDTVYVRHLITGTVEGRVTWQRGGGADFNGSQVQSIRIETGGGNDDVCIANKDEPFDIPMFIDGGAGHDVLAGGNAADTIVGGGGDDWIAGNSMNGGLGQDIFAYSYYRYDKGFDIGSPTPVRDYSGAAINNNGAGDLLYADALPPVQPQAAPLAAKAAAPTPVASTDPIVTMPAAVLSPAPFAHTFNPLLEGDAAEVWGTAA
jgi:Ca2+-binding RTX toxin-like protein